MADDKKKAAAAKPAKPAKEAAAAKPAKAKAKPAAADAGPAARTEGRPRGPATRPRLMLYFREKVQPELMKKFGYSSAMQAPQLVKIVINMGVGDAISDAKLMDAAANELGQIAGQKPSVR